MLNRFVYFILLMVFSTTIMAADRHYMTDWTPIISGRYKFRGYLFKPDPAQKGYQRHYFIYYPESRQYIYMYDPIKRVYYARFDRETKDPHLQYSAIAEEYQSPLLKRIPEEAYSEPGKLPPIPFSEGKTVMLSPVGKSHIANKHLSSLAGLPKEEVLITGDRNAAQVVKIPSTVNTSAHMERTITVVRPKAPPPMFREEKVTVYETRTRRYVTWVHGFTAFGPTWFPVYRYEEYTVPVTKTIVVPNRPNIKQ
jgi:hypothetical protein